MMETLFIPQPDSIPVGWGWFQFLLLLTFPLHLIAMNMMVGGFAVGIVQHLRGGKLEKELAHRITIALPLVIAFTVNLGVAPLLFVQVLYGQFIYTSSILMGIFWILAIPVLITAYYGAYLYDFKFAQLGLLGPIIGIVVLVLLLTIAFAFSNNTLLMVTPERFGEYFSNRSGTMLAVGQQEFWPRYVHMVLGSLAVGCLFVGLLGRFKASANADMAFHAERVALRGFFYLTLANIVAGFWYLLSLPAQQRNLFLGDNLGATIFFVLGLLLATGAILSAYKNKYRLTVGHAIGLVFVMSFLRAWLRSGYLQEFFTLEQLKVVPQYSPMIFFGVTLAMGVVFIGWLLKVTYVALQQNTHG